MDSKENIKKPLTPMQQKLRSNTLPSSNGTNLKNITSNGTKFISNIPTSKTKQKRTNEFISKTPNKTGKQPETNEKQATKIPKLLSNKSENDNDNDLLDKMSMNPKPEIKSSSAKKPTLTRDLINKLCTNTPGKRDLTFAKNIKYNPDFETGIPWIKPKKCTEVKPFKFASSERAKIRETKHK